ncbi:unnamed protein product, partial [Mesorhabditis spiculigera]
MMSSSTFDKQGKAAGCRGPLAAQAAAQDFNRRHGDDALIFRIWDYTSAPSAVRYVPRFCYQGFRASYNNLMRDTVLSKFSGSIRRLQPVLHQLERLPPGFEEQKDRQRGVDFKPFFISSGCRFRGAIGNATPWGRPRLCALLRHLLTQDRQRDAPSKQFSIIRPLLPRFGAARGNVKRLGDGPVFASFHIYRPRIFNATPTSSSCSSTRAVSRQISSSKRNAERLGDEPTAATPATSARPVITQDRQRDADFKQFFIISSGFFPSARKVRQCKAQPEAEEEQKLELLKNIDVKEDDKR